MSVTKGPNVPHRTSRSIAVEKGTTPAGFAGGIPGYCAPCGVPSSEAHGHYKDDADKVKGSGPGKPSRGINPIK